MSPFLFLRVFLACFEQAQYELHCHKRKPVKCTIKWDRGKCIMKAGFEIRIENGRILMSPFEFLCCSSTFILWFFKNCMRRGTQTALITGKEPCESEYSKTSLQIHSRDSGEMPLLIKDSKNIYIFFCDCRLYHLPSQARALHFASTSVAHNTFWSALRCLLASTAENFCTAMSSSSPLAHP